MWLLLATVWLPRKCDLVRNQYVQPEHYLFFGRSTGQGFSSSVLFLAKGIKQRVAAPKTYLALILYALALSFIFKVFTFYPWFQILPEAVFSGIAKQACFQLQDGDLTERTVLLNNLELELTPDDELPDLIPMKTDPKESLTLPAYGIAFWVLISPDLGSLCK